MIRVNFNTYNNYVTDSLYQWDVNRDLIINGLNLSTAPEIHFANANMDRAIVRKATLEGGVITVRIPNSLLQEALTIKAYVGIYEGEVYRTIELIEIPVIARERPLDYTLTDGDEEVYSFKALENKLDNTLAVSLERYGEVNAKYEDTNEKYGQSLTNLQEAELTRVEANDKLTLANEKYNSASADYDIAKKMADESKNAYDKISEPTYAETVADMTNTNKVYIGNNGNLWAYTKGIIEHKANQYNPNTAKFDYRLHINYIGTANDPWRVGKGWMYVEIDDIDLTNKTSYIIRISGVEIVRHSFGATGSVSFFNQPASTAFDLTGHTKSTYFDFTGSVLLHQDDKGYYFDLMDANPATDTVRCIFGITLADNVSVSAANCENLFIEAVPLTTYTAEHAWRDTGLSYIKYEITDNDITNIVEKVEKNINATMYVNGENGNDANTGSQSKPLKTIQKAIDSGASLILVKSGAYNETVTITRNNVHICLDTYPNFSTSVPRLEKIQVNNMVIRNCNNITIEDVEVIGNTVSAFYAKNVSNLNMVECTAHDGNRVGFELYNVNGRFSGCTAYNLDYQGDPLDHVDGFNIHGYGYTEFVNCSAWNCGDDGISHHDGCTGLISGGEFYGCGKGGVASPANGAEITIEGVYSHDNVYGLYAVSSGSKAYVKNCVFKNNTYDLTVGQNVAGFAWNNIYDTKSVADGFTEFNS